MASIDGPFGSIPGGTTRANDGSFVARRYEPNASGNIILHYAPGGRCCTRGKRATASSIPAEKGVTARGSMVWF